MTEKTEKNETQKSKDEIKSGFEIRVHQKIKEGSKERIQIFEGIVLAINGKGQSRTITVRKMSSGIGVEKIFPLASPSLTKIEIVKKYKIRQSKLYYLRNKKSKKLKEKRPVRSKK